MTIDCSAKTQAVMAQHTYQRLLLHRPEFPKEISFLISEYVVLTAEDEEGIIQGFVQREWTRFTVTEQNGYFFQRIRSIQPFPYAMRGVTNPPTDNAEWFRVANQRVSDKYPKSFKQTLKQGLREVVTHFDALDAPRYLTRSLDVAFHPYQETSLGPVDAGPNQMELTSPMWQFEGDMVFVEPGPTYCWDEAGRGLSVAGKQLTQIVSPSTDPKLGDKAVLAPFTLKSENDQVVYCPFEMVQPETTLFLDLGGIQYACTGSNTSCKLFVLPIEREMVQSTGYPNDIVDWNFSIVISAFHMGKSNEEEVLSHRKENDSYVQDTFYVKYRRTALPAAIKEANATAAADKDKNK